MLMLNEYLITPGILLFLLIPLGYMSLLANFSEEMGDKFEGTLWSRIRKMAWLPERGSGTGGGFILILYMFITLPVLVGCCLTGYFQSRSNDSGIKVMSYVVGLLGSIFFLSLSLWLYHSI